MEILSSRAMNHAPKTKKKHFFSVNMLLHIFQCLLPHQVRMEEEPYPRQMGNTTTHAVKLQQHLHDQMLAQSEFCDVTLSFCGVVRQ